MLHWVGTWNTRIHHHNGINKTSEFNYRKHSIFEYFLPDGFEMGSLALNISKARFISRIRVRSRSHAVFLYSKVKKMCIITDERLVVRSTKQRNSFTVWIHRWVIFRVRWLLQGWCDVWIFQCSRTVIFANFCIHIFIHIIVVSIQTQYFQIE